MCHLQTSTTYFFLIIKPRYVNELKDVRELYEIYSVDTRSIILEIIPKFYNYIMAAELSETPYTTPHAVTTTNRYL